MIFNCYSGEEIENAIFSSSLGSSATALIGRDVTTGASSVKPISSSHFLPTTTDALGPRWSMRSWRETLAKEVAPLGRPRRGLSFMWVYYTRWESGSSINCEKNAAPKIIMKLCDSEKHRKDLRTTERRIKFVRFPQARAYFVLFHSIWHSLIWRFLRRSGRMLICPSIDRSASNRNQPKTIKTGNRTRYF